MFHVRYSNRRCFICQVFFNFVMLHQHIFLFAKWNFFFLKKCITLTDFRDIPPSMAISIAEGKLNPCTMKAFPSADASCTTTFQNDKLLRDDMKTVASQESCFTVVSSHKSIRKRITGKFLTMHTLNYEGFTVYMTCEKYSLPTLPCSTNPN